MFCYKCGKQIRDDSSFCQYCGAAQDSSTQDVARNHSTSSTGELDRGALNVYLGNILSLECIKQNHQRKINAIEDSIWKTKFFHRIIP